MYLLAIGAGSDGLYYNTRHFVARGIGINPHANTGGSRVLPGDGDSGADVRAPNAVRSCAERLRNLPCDGTLCTSDRSAASQAEHTVCWEISADNGTSPGDCTPGLTRPLLPPQRGFRLPLPQLLSGTARRRHTVHEKVQASFGAESRA